MAPSATELKYDASKAKAAVLHLKGREDHDLVLRTFRVLIADLVQQYNGGHPG
jgi:dihydroxyacetone synthase